MSKDTFCRSKETAWRVLLECGVKEFPVDPWKICRHYGIVVDLCNFDGDMPGISFVYGGIPMAFIRSSEPPNRQRFILAHEIGHIMLGHVGAWGSVADNRPPSRKERERAAMAFAAELLMPQCVLLQTDISSVDQIVVGNKVPFRAAFYSLKETERRRRSGAPFTTLEAEICEQFSDYIATHSQRTSSHW